MNITRNAFIKRIMGGLAAIGIGAKVAAERRKKPPEHYVGIAGLKSTRDLQRAYNEAVSDMIAVLPAPARIPIVSPEAIAEFQAECDELLWTRTKQNPDGTVSVTRTVKYTFDKP